MPGDIPYQVQLPAERAALPGAPGGAATPREARRALVHVAVAHHRRCAARCFADHRRRSRPSPGRPPPSRSAQCARLPVVDAADLDAVARQLGREPRGVLEIAYRCPNGEPGVVKTAPRLPDGTPFPTLYYLTHPVLTAAASRLESVGPDARDDRTAAAGPAAGRRVPQGARVLPGRARCDRVAGHDVFRRRHARAGQVSACA